MSGRPAEARSPKPSAQPRPAQPRPGQPSPAHRSPAQALLPNALQRLFLPDSEVPFSAARRLRFWCVIGPFGAAVPLRLAVLEGPCLVRSWRAKVPPSRAKHARLCVFGAQPSPAQPSPAHSPAQALVWALPKLCQRLFLILPNAFSYWIQTYRFPAQPSTAQLVHPSLGVGLAKALPKAFSYRIWPVSGRPAAAFPCFEGVGLDCRSAQPKALKAQPRLAPAQASPAQARSAQPSSPQPGPSLGAGLAERFAKAFLTGFRRSHFRPRDGSVFGAFFGPFGAAVPLRLAVLEGPCLVRSWRAKVPPSRAKHARLCHGQPNPKLTLPESSLAVGLPTPASEVQPSPAHTQTSRSLAPSPHPSPAQPKPSPGQPAQSVQARPAEALPKLCARHFRKPLSSMSARPSFGGEALRLGFWWSAQPTPAHNPARISPSPGQPSPGQVSPAQLTAARPKPWCAPCRTLCKGFSYRIQRSHFRPRDGSVFGAFLARLGPPYHCVWLFWSQRFFLLDSDVPFSSPAQHSPASPPKPWCGPSQSFAKGFFLPDLARVRPPCRCVSLF